MAKTYEELLSGAQQIKENELPESNTHDLVGEQLIQMINRASEDKAAIDKSVNDEASNREASATALQKNIDAEAARAKSAEQKNSEAIAAEASSRQSGDAALSESLTQLGVTVTANSQGLAACRGESTLTLTGTEWGLNLIMNIGKGGPVTLPLPVHGGDDGYTAVATPALIDPQMFGELMGLFTSLENETKSRTEADASMNTSIEALIKNTAKLTASISPSLVFRSEDTVIVTMTAKMSVVTPDKITLKQDTLAFHTVEEAAEATEATEMAAISNYTFNAVAEYGSMTFTASAILKVVDPVFFGSGAAYTDIITDENRASIRQTVAGEYTVTVEKDGDYVWFLVADTVGSIKKATMSGFDFPLEAPETVLISYDSNIDVAFKCYRSTNPYTAGTFKIVLS